MKIPKNGSKHILSNFMDLRRSINTKVWNDAWFEGLNPKEKLVWLYLLTNPLANILGIYEISIRRIAYDTGLLEKEVEMILKAFEGFRKAFYWFGRIFLPNWIRNQAMNDNMMKGAKNLFDDLHNDLKNKLKENGFEAFESLSKGWVTLPEKEKEKEKEKEIGQIRFDFDNLKSVFEEFRKQYPGTKRGLDTELKDFKDKHKDCSDVIPSLITNLNRQKAERNSLKGFIPQWPNLKTYLSQRRWEQIYQEEKHGIQQTQQERRVAPISQA